MQYFSLIQLFTQLALMMALALVCGGAARRLHQPAIVGELLGGIILGPTVIGSIEPQFYMSLFPTKAADPVTFGARDAIMQMGLLLFLFSAGREVNWISLRQNVRHVLFVSLLGISIPFVAGYMTVLTIPGLFRDAGMPTTASVGNTAFFYATALSISALPVIIRILHDLGLLQRRLGVVVLAAATISDLVGWFLFSIFLHQGTQAPWRGIALLCGISLGLLFIMRPLIVRSLAMWNERPDCPAIIRVGIPVLVALFVASMTEWAGLHAVFGAFMAGTLFSTGEPDNENSARSDSIRELSFGFFAPLYFVSVGQKANFVTDFNLVLALVTIAMASISKFVGAGIGARLGGMPWKEAIGVGFAMNARGAMEILMATIALDAGMIPKSLFVALVIMALVTSLLAAPGVKGVLGAKDSVSAV